MPVKDMTFTPGQILISRETGARVRIVDIYRTSGRLEVKNTKTGRMSTMSQDNARKKYRVEGDNIGGPAPSRTSSKTLPPLTTEREKAIMRIVKKKFSDFHQRGQSYYLGAGMSTTHVVTALMADINDIGLFWPSELVNRRFGGGTTYTLERDVFKRVQSRVSETLKQLETKGYLEKCGNSDERRWKPTYAA